MTDRSYTGLRAALDAGPKGGKWTWKQVGSFSTPGCAVFWPDASKGGTHYRRLDSGGGMEQADAEFIANADPATIRALLADYDEAERALTLSGKVNKDLIDTALELTERIAKMEGALYAALPFVEDAEDDATYKPGAVRAARKQILAALAQEGS